MISSYTSLYPARIAEAAVRGFRRRDASEPFPCERGCRQRRPAARGRSRTAEARGERPHGHAAPSLQALGSELSALARIALSRLWHAQPSRDTFDPGLRHPIPLVLVHGLFGSATNFLSLRRFLSARGLGNFATFSYPPRLDHQRLALLLGREIAAVCRATGSRQVDVVGHSFGGLVARYLVEMEDGGPVRRLITLGSPYFSNRLARQELAIFAAADPLVTPPDPAHGPRGRVLLVARCGHLGLLCHRTVLAAVFRFLSAPTAEAAARVSTGEHDSMPPALRVAGGWMAPIVR